MKTFKFVFIAILAFFTTLQANLINTNFNLGYTFSTSAETKFINYKGKDYAVAGIDSVTGQPIFGQVLNGKLTGNFAMFANNGAIRVPKPTMSVMGNNYQFGNFVRDPRTILGGAVVGDVIYGYVSPEPANNGFQAIGGIINKIENKIKEENNKQ